MLNLDTHILIWALSGDLTKKEKKLLQANEWSISAISLWEIFKLNQLGRIDIDLDDLELKTDIQALKIWPLNYEVCSALNKLDFKSDPADEIIAATSLVYKVPLVTRDKIMLRSKIIPKAL